VCNLDCNSTACMIRESTRRCVSLSAPLFFPLDCAVRQSSTVLLPPLSLVNLCSGSIDVQFQAPDICDIAVAITSLISFYRLWASSLEEPWSYSESTLDRRAGLRVWIFQLIHSLLYQHVIPTHVQCRSHWCAMGFVSRVDCYRSRISVCTLTRKTRYNGVIGYDTQTVGTSVDTFRGWVFDSVPPLGLDPRFCRGSSICHSIWGTESYNLFSLKNWYYHSFPSGMWISSLIPYIGIRPVIHSHRGSGFLNPIPSGNPPFLRIDMSHAVVAVASAVMLWVVAVTDVQWDY
jgi:hypothetical protein